MRVAIVSDFHSLGMGYTENCLPRALADAGHRVDVVASNLNVYGNSPTYDSVYREALGPRQQEIGSFQVDNYTLHRLPATLVSGYVHCRGLVACIRRLQPDVLQLMSVASLNSFSYLFSRERHSRPVFAECHQHLSVVRDHLREGIRPSPKGLAFLLSRTLPSRLAHRVTSKCYAIAPDCAWVARKLYGIPARKIELLSLGVDTTLFVPVRSADSAERRTTLRKDWGVGSEFVFLYTGRLTAAKDPALLARAVSTLRRRGAGVRGVFVGQGPQFEEIAGTDGCLVVPFVPHAELPNYYRAADAGVWPREESMSMLDAAACGLPIVVGDKLQAHERVDGNGLLFEEGSLERLIDCMGRLIGAPEVARAMGELGSAKIRTQFGWDQNAHKRLVDYEAARTRAQARSMV